MSRNFRLRHVNYRHEITHTDFLFPHQMQKPQPSPVGQGTKQTFQWVLLSHDGIIAKHICLDVYVPCCYGLRIRYSEYDCGDSHVVGNRGCLEGPSCDQRAKR
jgi:hypothetical protein